MNTLRTLKQLLLGETWILPLGIVAILAAGALFHHLAGRAWAEAGSLGLSAAVLVVLSFSVSRTARNR
jgi:hypothetical protein